MLFAQFNNQKDMAPEEAGVLLGFICVVLIVYFVVMIFFLLTLHKLLKKCRSRNRAMEPGLVWLNLIPCFQLIWQFVTVVRVDETLQQEFRQRGLGRRGDSYGKGLGIAACTMGLVANVAGNISSAIDKAKPEQADEFHALDYVCWILMVVTLILFVTYWFKMAGFSRRLSESPRDDEYDDRPRRRSRRDEWEDEDDDRPRRRTRRDEWEDEDDRPPRRRDDGDDDDGR